MTGNHALIVAYDRLGPFMAGPALRSLALAEELAGHMPVSVLFDGEPGKPVGGDLDFISQGSVELSGDFFNRFSSVLAPPLVAMTTPGLLETDIPLAIDLFDPVVWENLELYKSSPLPEREFQHERHLAALLAGLIRGDYFLVAGSRQLDLFLGALMALNRVNPATCVPDSGPEQLIGLVPFGLPNEDPPDIETLRRPGEFEASGPLVVWGGGMWDWLSPELIVKAWPEVLGRFPDARLAFPGTVHPNPHVPAPDSVRKVKSLADSSGVSDSLIFSDWLTRDNYLALLAHADCGVSAHRPGLESRYAVRTRFLDAIWMGLPQVVSGGDEYSGLLNEYQVGTVIDSNDPMEFARGVIEILEAGKNKYSSGFNLARKQLPWSRMSEPLITWMKSPRLTHGEGAGFFSETLGGVSPRERPSDFKSLLGRVIAKLSKR